jgi:hypothetical protein
MVETFQNAVTELEKIDNVCLFAILKMDELADRWTLIFGLDDVSERQRFFDIAKAIIDSNISRDDSQNIARIGVFPLTDHLISELLKYPAKQELKEIKANGNFIHHGYILISRTIDNLRLDV